MTTHSGKITCESEVGRGSTFTLVFPAAEALSETPIVQAAAVPLTVHTSPTA